MSFNISLRRSPKPGALTAHALIVPRALLTTNVASASPSMSSAISRIDLPAPETASSTGTKSRMLAIFLSTIRMYGSSSSTT